MKGCTLNYYNVLLPNNEPLTNQIYIENEWNICVIH